MTMTYASLTGSKTTPGSIRSWVNYDRLDIDQVLEEAQAMICQRLRVREMLTIDDTLATVTGTEYRLALPANFLAARGLRSLKDNLSYQLRSADYILAARQFDANGSVLTGPPQYYAPFDGFLQFEARFANLITQFHFLCFKSLPLLSGGNQSNFLTDRYPHLLRTACLAQAADFMRNDNEYLKQMQRLEALIETTNAEHDLSMSAATYETMVA